MPAAFHYLAGPAAVRSENDLSLEISIVLLLAYGTASAVLAGTHKQLFAGEEPEEAANRSAWSLKKVAADAGGRDGR